MDADLGMPIINKEPRTGLAESLEGYTKSILFKIGDKTNVPLKKSYKKVQIAKEMAEAVQERLRTSEADLTEEDWELLHQAAEAKMLEVEREELSSYTNLAEHGYIFVFRKGVTMQLTVPEEIIEVLDELGGADSSETRKDTGNQSEQPDSDLDENEAAFLKMYENTKRIYGAANLTHLAKVWNDYHEVQFSVEDVKAIVEKSQ